MAVTVAMAVTDATAVTAAEVATAPEATAVLTPRRGTVGLTPDNALASVPREDLEIMALAAARLSECIRVLSNTGDSIVGELLKTRDDYTVWKHYPPGDVRDPNTHSQFYYHAHPEKLRPGEHGHFHTFIRGKGIPDDLRQSSRPGNLDLATAEKPMAHLVAIAMNERGMPITLFTVNRWVTKDTWFDADETIALLDRFVVDTAHPSWPVNQWVSCMLVLFRPQIEALIRERDDRLDAWQPSDPGTETLNDRALEITSMLDISLRDQISAVDRALSA